MQLQAGGVAMQQNRREAMTLSAECSASSTPDAVVMGPAGLNDSPKKAPRLRALPKMELSACLDITTLDQAQTVLSQLEELRCRVLRAFPQAGEANGGHNVQRRSLLGPPLPGSVEDDNSCVSTLISEAQESRIRAIVREEMRRQHSAEDDDWRQSRFSRSPPNWGRTPSRSCSPGRLQGSTQARARPAKNHSPHAPAGKPGRAPKDKADWTFETSRLKKGKREKSRPSTPFSGVLGRDSPRAYSDSGESTMAHLGSDDAALADDPQNNLTSPICERPSQERALPSHQGGTTPPTRARKGLWMRTISRGCGCIIP